jgi:acetyl esterase/lipase
MNQREFFTSSVATAVLAETAIAPAEQDAIIVTKDLSYREGNNAWTLDLAMPSTSTLPTPAILMIHGGGWLGGDKGIFAAHCLGFAKLGYFCASINYRLSAEAPFPAAIEDSKCAMRWLRAHAAEYNVDPSLIGVLGNSAGGHLALMLGMAGKDAGLEGDGPYQDQSSMAHCVVSDSGPTTIDPRALPGLHRAVMGFLKGPEATLAERVRRGSPINYVTARTPPLLLIYGAADNQVAVGEVDDFVAATWRTGSLDVTYIRLGTVGHCPYHLQKVEFVRPIVAAFLQRTLASGDRQSAKDGPASPG